MAASRSTSHRRKAVVFALVAFVFLTWIGVSLSTSTVTIRSIDAPAGALSVDEATYYEYVAPRLDRLVREIDEVTELVRARSRNVVSLNVHGNRIKQLSEDIVSYGTTNGVPERFRAVHDRIATGTTEVTSAIDDAKSALQRFEFSAIPNLIPRFEGGATTLHEARTLLGTFVA